LSEKSPSRVYVVLPLPLMLLSEKNPLPLMARLVLTPVVSRPPCVKLVSIAPIWTQSLCCSALMPTRVVVGADE
jgi:hypothetical protein